MSIEFLEGLTPRAEKCRDMILGVIAGDMIGSVYEGRYSHIKEKTGWPLFLGGTEYAPGASHFTDDTSMTLAVCLALTEAVRDGGNLPTHAVEAMQYIGNKYHWGVGRGFKAWLASDNPQPYNSWGNGAAMRVSPCAALAGTPEDVKRFAHAVTAVTHNHPEGLKGAEAVAMCLHLALQGQSPEQVQAYCHGHYYPMDFMVDDIRADYAFDTSCQGSVPQALKAAFEGPDYESVVRSCVALGGDADTQAAIAGGLAAVFYGLPEEIAQEAWARMPQGELRGILGDFLQLVSLTGGDALMPEARQGAAPLEQGLKERLEGCLYGVFCGDALGAPIEFKYPEELAARYPDGVDTFVQGWNGTARRWPGYITDDSEMAIALLRSLVETDGFCAQAAKDNYLDWLDTDPHDVGFTIAGALTGSFNPQSQANGALMRVAPIALYAALHPAWDWMTAAREDAEVTHIHPKCGAANIIYVESVMLALKGEDPLAIYARALRRAEQLGQQELADLLEKAATEEPEYYPQVGWLHHGFHAAYYWLLHAKDFRSAILHVVNKLGDPDTNGAIVGALLGAHFGMGGDGIPEEWVRTLQEARQRTQRYSVEAGLDLLHSLSSLE